MFIKGNGIKGRVVWLTITAAIAMVFAVHQLYKILNERKSDALYDWKTRFKEISLLKFIIDITNKKIFQFHGSPSFLYWAYSANAVKT
ncbi:hypothetical protein [Halobacillus alkaliphilus]|uniref:hypothetical protein n=1 Tax=Halobacillus alkaliphilus TaxID=396056 RepID=UPI000B7D888C|nr:hypothetical protein [Halobacillus alkaliphilus]